jgi:predicted DNA-binding transcriptional regulator YafY
MRRADRLFRLVGLLRRLKVVTARRLADELEVSERTVYRDVADLVASGVPIRGEAGVGYALDAGFDLPPLMFTDDEIEALVLGARMVESWCDPALADAARDVLAKVEHALPRRLRARYARTALFVPDFGWSLPGSDKMEVLRRAIREQRIVRMAYTDARGNLTERTIHPLGLFIWGGIATFGAWCTLRQDFRTFRPDRIDRLEVLEQTFDPSPGQTLQDYFRHAVEHGEG